MHWQVQEAKQRFSEVLRAVENDGPQTITRHGEEVAVLVNIAEYRRLTKPKKDLKELLLGPPYFEDEMVAMASRSYANGVIVHSWPLSNVGWMTLSESSVSASSRSPSISRPGSFTSHMPSSWNRRRIRCSCCSRSKTSRDH